MYAIGMMLDALELIVSDESRAVDGVENCGNDCGSCCLTEELGEDDDLNDKDSLPVSENKEPSDKRLVMGLGSWKIADRPLGGCTGSAG